MSQARDFWSRRKAAVQAETEADCGIMLPRNRSLRHNRLSWTIRVTPRLLAEIRFARSGSCCRPGSDVSGFMAKAIPERSAPSRPCDRLWRLNPVLANVDGLVDYGEDYTDASCVIENIQTAYQVGKGNAGPCRGFGSQLKRAEEEPYVATRRSPNRKEETGCE